jgi:uncharacterized membrane protein
VDKVPSLNASDAARRSTRTLDGVVIRVLFRAASILAIPIALVGCFVAALAIADIYMVGIAGVAPGEPIYLDTLAPSLGSATIQLGIGIVTIALALVVRLAVRRRLAQLDRLITARTRPA